MPFPQALPEGLKLRRVRHLQWLLLLTAILGAVAAAAPRFRSALPSSFLITQLAPRRAASPHRLVRIYRLVMALNAIQFQKGLSLPEFQRLYGTEELCQGALEKSRWPDGFRCPRCNGHEHGGLSMAGGSSAISAAAAASGHPHGRHDHAGHKTASHHLVSGLLSDWPVQNWDLFTRAQPLLGSQLRHGLAGAQQDPARND